MEELGCPRCKTTKYRNPSLKLMVNVCGHALCENCVELLFVRGSGACPECNVPLRRNNFRVQLFEDAVVEKEVDIRKRVLKDFNKKEEDFSRLDEYNDYLEMVETIIYNLTNSIDVEQTNRRIDKYKKENQDQIKKSRTKLSRDEEFLEELIEMEKEESEKLRQEVLQEQLQERTEKVKNRAALIDKLMFSEGPADQIVASHRRALQEAATAQAQAQAQASSVPRARHTQFSSGIAVGRRQQFFEVPKADVGIQFSYTPIEMSYVGPEPPNYDNLEEYGYIKYIRKATAQEQGGGFQSNTACYRALQDAFAGLYFTHDLVQQHRSANPQSMLVG